MEAVCTRNSQESQKEAVYTSKGKGSQCAEEDRDSWIPRVLMDSSGTWYIHGDPREIFNSLRIYFDMLVVHETIPLHKRIYH